MCQRGTAHLATLKSKKSIYKLIAFLMTLQRLIQEWQKSPALGPGKQMAKTWFGLEKSVLRIRDVYPGSRMRLFSIPDPGSELSPSRIPDPHQRI
jgi:hypothetical protein